MTCTLHADIRKRWRDLHACPNLQNILLALETRPAT